MSSSFSGAANQGDGDTTSQREYISPPPRRSIQPPENFVLGRAESRPGDSGSRSGRGAGGAAVSSSSAAAAKGHYTGGVFPETTDGAHALTLYEQLSADLGDLLNRTDISDCFLNVKGTFMAVHKCILAARSNAFAAVISGNFNRLETSVRSQLETLTHKDKLVIVINKTEPQIMKQVVIFMYTAKCDLNEGNAYALLDAAGRYDIKDLKVHTGRFLASRINANNVLMLLEAAYKYDNKLVKQRCIEFFINHAKEIMEVHELWKQFAERQQVIVAELLHWLVNRDTFYANKPDWDAISRWP